MYATSVEFNKSIFLQGDIITGFPFLSLKDEYVFLEKDGSKFLRSENPSVETENLIAVTSKKSSVIIISHSCDIEQRNIVLIAPVYSLQSLISEGLVKNSQIENLKDRKINYLFYLPPFGSEFEESVALLNSIHYVSKEMLNKFKDNKIISLSDWGRHHLGYTLGVMLGRPILDKNS